MNNMPEVKLGIIAVSRDCFPDSAFCKRRKLCSLHKKNMEQMTAL